MAHELEIAADGKAKMAYVGEVPWHGLGVQMEGNPSPAEMLAGAGLDWTVSKRELNFAQTDGTLKKSAWTSLVRDTDQREFTCIRDDWNPLQNATAFEVFDDLFADGTVTMESAGALFEGRRVWGLAKMNQSWELFNGDVMDSYLLVMNPHEYGYCIQVQFTPTRVVCNNTLSYALNTADMDKTIRVGHRAHFDGAWVKKQLGLSVGTMAKLKEQAAFLGTKRTTAETMAKYFAELLPSTAVPKKNEDTGEGNLGEETMLGGRSAKRCFELVTEQPGANFAEGSWWQPFNALTYFLDHEYGRTPEGRFFNAQMGANKDLKKKGLRKALEFAEQA